MAPGATTDHTRAAGDDREVAPARHRRVGPSSYFEVVTETRALLQHFLAALAYRTQKALRDAPDSFADFRAGPTSRTPKELVWHMTSVIGYARTMFHGGRFTPPAVATFADEVARFHETLAGLSADFADDSLTARISDQQFLHGPVSYTHLTLPTNREV